MHDYNEFAFIEDAIPPHEAARESGSLLVRRTERGFQIDPHDPLDPSAPLVSINRAAELIIQSLDAGCSVDVDMGSRP
jgi:hypothetical protein